MKVYFSLRNLVSMIHHLHCIFQRNLRIGLLQGLKPFSKLILLRLIEFAEDGLFEDILVLELIELIQYFISSFDGINLPLSKLTTNFQDIGGHPINGDDFDAEFSSIGLDRVDLKPVLQIDIDISHIVVLERVVDLV